METPPHFFYNPNAYTLGIIKQLEGTCQCCKQQRPYIYQGNFYSHETIDLLCPWCIADGSAAETFDGSFVEDFADDQPVSEESGEAVSTRTPGYSSWQGAIWLSHCGEACVFRGYVGREEVAAMWQEVLPDILASGWNTEDVQNYLSQDGSMIGYLFQCPTCSQHRLHIDSD